MVQRLTQALHGKNTIKGATGLLMVTLFLSNILGFLRDRFLAQKIPAADIDVYFNAFRLPDLIFNVLILGAVTTAFIPVFTDYLFKKEKSEEAWRLANTVINVAIIGLAAILLILVIFMPVIIPIVSPFREPERVAQTILLARVLLIQPFFFGLSYIAGSILNSYKRFVAYSISPLIYNASIIGGIVYLTPKFGIMGVVYGVLIGAFLHFLIQVPTLFSLGYNYRPIIDLKAPGLKKIGELMLPRTIQLIMMQVLILAFARAAAQLPIGSASGLAFADNIQTVPTVIFGNAFAMASFPYLSEAFSGERLTDFNHYLVRATKVALFFLLPSAAGLYLLRVQIVRLILGSGHFGWDQTIMTSEALGMYAIGIVALGLLPIFSRAFFAMHDTRTPMWVAIPTTIVSIIVGYILAYHTNMGIAGLALAFSLSSISQLVILYLVLRRKIAVTFERDLFISALTYLLLTLIMGVSIQIAKTFVGSTADLRLGINVLYQGGLGILVGGLVYLGVAALLRLEEVTLLWQKKKIFTTN
jgi:putative peptidoglycan lipid II flippase